MNELKPEALRLADELDAAPYSRQCANAAAAELRRLYQEVQRLEADLDDMYYQNSMNGEEFDK